MNGKAWIEPELVAAAITACKALAWSQGLEVYVRVGSDRLSFPFEDTSGGDRIDICFGDV